MCLKKLECKYTEVFQENQEVSKFFCVIDKNPTKCVWFKADGEQVRENGKYKKVLKLNEILKTYSEGFGLRDGVDTHSFSRLVEVVDEAGFDGYAAQGQAHQQDQQVLHPVAPSPLLAQPGWHWRPSGMGVHHIHRGISSRGHTYSAHSVTERRFCVEMSPTSCQRVLLQSVTLERQREVIES